MKNLSEEMIRIHQLMSFEKGKNTISESTQILVEGVKKQYKLLIEEGDELFSNGDYDGALVKYKEANNLFVDKPNHKFFIESQQKIKNTENKIVEKQKLEETKKINEFLTKIDNILKKEINAKLQTLLSDLKLKFGFSGSQYVMYDASNSNVLLSFDSNGWGGKTETLRYGKGYFELKQISAVDYVETVNSNLTDDEKINFEKVGYIPSIPDKSIKNMFDSGSIGIWLKGLNPDGSINQMGWERCNVSGSGGQMEDTCFKDVKTENIYKNGTEEIPYDKILYVEGSGLTEKKRIGYGGIKIYNSNVGVGLATPINDILFP